MAAPAPSMIPSVVIAPAPATATDAPTSAMPATFVIPVSSPSSRPETPVLPSRSSQPCPGATRSGGPNTRPSSGLNLPGPVPATSSTYEQPKRRRRTTPHELGLLESAFAKNPMPTPEQRQAIADSVGMTTRATQIWFQSSSSASLHRAQNRRQKEKRDREQGIVAPARPPSPGPSSGSAPEELPQQRSTSAGPMRTVPFTRTMSEPVSRAPSPLSLGNGTLFDTVGGRVMRVDRAHPSNPSARQAIENTTRRLWERMPGSDDVELAGDDAPELVVRGPRRPPMGRSTSLDVVASRGSAHLVSDRAGRELRRVNTTLANGSAPGMSHGGSSDAESDEVVTPNASMTIDPIGGSGGGKAMMPMADVEAADLLLSLGSGQFFAMA